MPTLYSSQVKCPTCSEWQNEIWIDEETNVKMTKKS
jgi:phage FluMu protein Com